MKNIFLFNLLFIISVVYYGCAASPAQLSSQTQMLINEYNMQKEKQKKEGGSFTLPPKLIDRYNIRFKDNLYFADALITVNEIINEFQLNRFGIQVNSKIKNTWSVSIPLDKIDNLINLEGVEFIDIGHKVFKR